MNSNSFNSSRHTGWGNRLATTIKTAFWAAGLAGLMTLPVLGAERTWTGANSANWSDPNNWSPAGTPQNGDVLQFGYVSDSNRSMQNDIGNLNVESLSFANNSYTISGNSLDVSEGGIDNDGATGIVADTFTTTINCPLVFSSVYDTDITSGYTFGDFTPNHTLSSLERSFGAERTWHRASERVKYLVRWRRQWTIYISGVISGSGDLEANVVSEGGNISLSNSMARLGIRFLARCICPCMAIPK